MVAVTRARDQISINVLSSANMLPLNDLSILVWLGRDINWQWIGRLECQCIQCLVTCPYASCSLKTQGQVSPGVSELPSVYAANKDNMFPGGMA